MAGQGRDPMPGGGLPNLYVPITSPRGNLVHGSPRKCLSRPAGFRSSCRAALAYSIFHFSSPRPSTLATLIEASWAIWGESALHRIAHDATSSS